MKYTKILVPTDFSDCSKQALRYAEGLALRDEAELVLLHAVPPTDSPVYQVIKHSNFPNYEDEVRKSCTGLLVELQETLDPQVKSEVKVVEGFPRQEIAGHAEQGGFDAIVIGTHGHTGVKHALLGSVAEAVLRHAQCPVFTVRGDGKDTMPANIRKVLVATDFSDQGFEAVEYGREFVALTGAELVLAHVMDPPLYPDGPFGMVALQMPNLEMEIRNALSERLAKETDRLAREGASVRSVFLEGRAHIELVRCAKDENADLIVMGTHGRSGVKRLMIGSTAERVVRHAPCPVLTVHPFKD
jgi:nucleotide-binding universal stress UspA family protein